MKNNNTRTLDPNFIRSNMRTGLWMAVAAGIIIFMVLLAGYAAGIYFGVEF